MGIAVYSNCALVHGFEKSRLCFWTCPVDFIRKKDMGEYRPVYERKFLTLGIKDAYSRNVGGHHVRCKLDPLELEMKRSGNRTREKCFPDSRYVLNQQVATTNECNEGPLNDITFSLEDVPDFLSKLA